MSTSYKVVATWGAQEYTTELGEFATIEEAMDRVDRWQDAPEVQGMHMDFIEVMRIKKSESTVYSAHTAPSDCGEDGSETQEQYDIIEDIEKLRGELAKEIVAVRRDCTMDIMNSDSDIRSLQNEVYTLQDDVLAYKEIIEELKREVASRILEHTSNFEGAFENFEHEVSKEVHGLRREIESLRREMEALRESTAGRKG